MELDDQLAALAAGELDPSTAERLRARAATDPALARRLARHERLQDLLSGWDVPPMDDDAVARLDARLDEALAELDDGPLAEASRPATSTPAPAPARQRDEDVVADLGAARARRGRGRPTADAAVAGGGSAGWPSWVPGAAVAAVLLAVVGTGVVVGSLPGFNDASEQVAGGVQEDAAQDESADTAVTDGESASRSTSAALGPGVASDIAVEDGELLALLDADRFVTTVDPDGAGGTTSGGAGDDAADEVDEQAEESAAEPTDGSAEALLEETAAPTCVAEALERDTDGDRGEREVWLLADGTYAGEPAVFVVVRTFTDRAEDRYDVLAYDPADCTLLDRDAGSR